jgi:serine/threonine protein kinase
MHIENEQIGPYIVTAVVPRHPVYFARHTETGKEVVIKQATAIPETYHNADFAGSTCLVYEHELQERLKHPNICPVEPLFQHNNELYLITPNLGIDLYERLKEKPSREEKLKVLEDIADAITYCHSNDVIHLDVKDQNVIVKEGRGILIDFGSAREPNKPHPVAGQFVSCTPAYAPPECAKSSAYNKRSDTFSFAFMAYSTLAGDMPYKHLGNWIRYDCPTIKAEKLQEYGPLGELIIAGLRTKSKKRPDMKELADALKEQNSRQDRQPNEETLEPCLVSS